MTIGIISAMDSEHRRLVERLQDKNTSGDGSFRYVEGTLGGNHVILTQCGIGKVSAAVGASELIRRFSPDCIVSMTSLCLLPYEYSRCELLPLLSIRETLTP